MDEMDDTKADADEYGRVVFIDLDANLPVRFKHAHWQRMAYEVQYWHGTDYPVGLLWLSYDGLAGVYEVQYVFVMTRCRRKGIATRLLRACEEKFGVQRLVLTDPVSRWGEKLYRGWEERYNRFADEWNAAIEAKEEARKATGRTRKGAAEGRKG
jgi:GNAT superfamily N-acetyltransferase